MSSELPPELWLKVFQNLSLESLRNIHAVSSLFSDLSCGFLFEEFSFYLTMFATKTTIPLELERLAFWSSDKISPHVRSCNLNLRAIDGMSIVSESPPPLVSACVEAVSRFLNLRELRCSLPLMTDIEIPALHVEDHRHLKSLHIQAGRLAPPTSPTIRLKIQEFSYGEIPLPIPGAADSPFSYLSFFDSISLRRLHLWAESFLSIEHFLEDKSTMATFQNLHILDLVFIETTITQLHTCISPFPAIRDLSLKILRQCEAESLPSTPLAPHVRTYKGPADILPAVLLGSSPESLTISRDFTPDLFRALQVGGGAMRPSVASLTMQVAYPDLAQGSVLPDTLSFFPNLRDLSLTICSSRRGRPWPGSAPSVAPAGSDALCARLAAILGVVPLLENVVFNWWVEGGGYWGEIIPPLEDLEAVLLAAIPSLRRISYGNN
ncbi:hypothetical protein B0H19DRAFT_1261246 [Mycena capillaripes]|nr:hypothetical protein B0H19DRAFT_1261246 [Mycena capillaripes]